MISRTSQEVGSNFISRNSSALNAACCQVAVSFGGAKSPLILSMLARADAISGSLAILRVLSVLRSGRRDVVLAAPGFPPPHAAAVGKARQYGAACSFFSAARFRMS